MAEQRIEAKLTLGTQEVGTLLLPARKGGSTIHVTINVDEQGNATEVDAVDERELDFCAACGKFSEGYTKREAGMAGKSAGRSGGRWRKIVANQKAKRLPCWLCGQPINYNAKPGADDSFSVDHIKPLSTHPHLAEEPSNAASAHLLCNKQRGARDVKPSLGQAAETW